MAESPQVGFRLEERQQIMDEMRHSADMPRISEPVNWLICYLPIYSDNLAVGVFILPYRILSLANHFES
jgi:hypothetical protein